MYKDNYRDYVSEAYRYYALCGKPDQNELRVLRSSQVQTYRGGIADLEAVARVLDHLELEQDAQIWKRCLEIVYFSDPKHSPNRGMVTDRVRFAAMELCVSESTVYRMMRRLRMLLAMERGLRVDERELHNMNTRIKVTPRPECAMWYGTPCAPEA